AGSAEVIKVNANDQAHASVAAKQNECDFVLLTKLAVNGGSVRIGKMLDKSNDVVKTFCKNLPDWLRKRRPEGRNIEGTVELGQNMKNALNIKHKDKVSFTHSLVSLITSSQMAGNTYNEVAESEDKVVETLVNRVVQDVMAKAKVNDAALKARVSESEISGGNPPPIRPGEKQPG